MSFLSKWLPHILIGAGAILVIAAIGLILVFQNPASLASLPLPDRLSGLSISSEATGRAALQEFTQMHGETFPLVSGARVSYGPENQVTLWIASTASPTDTSKLLASMRNKIADGSSPFQPTGYRQEGSRSIYTLDGMGQKHFYFQSGKYLVWLAANSEMADRALLDTLRFYP